MPKMTHPKHERPLSVQDAEVDSYTAAGWSLVGAPAKPAKAETTEAKPVARKSAAKPKK